MSEPAGAVRCSRAALGALADNRNLTDFDSRVFFEMLGRVRSYNRIEPFTITKLAAKLGCSRVGLSGSLKRLQAEGVLYRDEPLAGSPGVYRMSPEIGQYIDLDTAAAMR